jgi:hypothetical protein
MNKTALVILIPIFALVSWVVSLEYQIATSQKIRIRVEGYDPRDLLSGHYINFSISTADKSPCKDQNSNNTGAAYCLCYIPSSDGIYHDPSWGGLCESKPKNCETFIRGLCNWNRFTVSADRYSFPEYYASVLQVLPPDSSAYVSVNKDGTTKVVKLYSKDQTLEDYAQQKLQESYLTPIPTVEAAAN